MTPAVAIDDRGVLVTGVPDVAVLVHFDEQYIWAFTPSKDGTAQGDGFRIQWPAALRGFLNGVTTVRLANFDGSEVWFDAEHSFGTGEGRVAFVDADGAPYSIDKVGHLTRSFLDTPEAIKQEVLVASQTVCRELTERCGLHAYLSYGALLGAVRENGKMIGHDSDVDLCYYTEHTSPADIILQSYRIERQLEALGWNVLRMSGGDLKVIWPLSDGSECHIDIFSAFKIDGVFYQLGNRNGLFDVADLLPLGTIELEGYEFPAPRDPEAMLNYIYGPTWKVPDPSFVHRDNPRGTVRLDGWLRGFRTEMGAWTETYRRANAPAIPEGPSDFARWVHEQIAPGAAIADLGAGLGRDAFWFDSVGHPSRAHDFSRYALRMMRARAYEQGHGPAVRQLTLNESRHVLHFVALLSRYPHHLYARELIGCLDEPARRALFTIGAATLRRGAKMFLEFSAPLPRGVVAPDQQPAGLVRRFDPAWLQREIVASGGRVEHLSVGPGVDMYDNPDPAVARMIVSWPHPNAKETHHA